MSKWLTVSEYAEKVGKSPQQVYMDIRLKKIPKSKVRAVKVKNLLEIEYDEQQGIVRI